MSSDSEERTSVPGEAIPTQGTKRDASSLFVDDTDFDDDLDSTSNQSTKRTKLEPGLDIDKRLAELQVGPDGEALPYDAEKEGRPQLAIYHDSFKEAERTAPDICSEFMTTYEQVKTEYDCNFPEIGHICEHNLKAFRHPQALYPKVGPIALLGPAGIGKSSFTGCVLDSRGAAPESDGGNRGTNVVHEYSAAMANQRALYEVKAIYFSESQIKNIVQTHCDNIFKLLSQGDEFDEDDPELHDLQKQHKIAIDFFQILLCDRDGFESRDDAQDYFEGRTEDEVEDVVTDLTALIEAFKDTRGLVDGVEHHSAETSGELAEIFKLVSRAPAIKGRSQQPHPWPLVIKVEIHQEKELLNAGVVLADCPGITDSNQAVVDSTMNYLKQAGTILIFEKIDRISTNEHLDATIRACIRLNKKNNLRLIVTMIDLKQRIKPEDHGDLSPRDRHLLEEAEGVVEALKKRKVFLKKQRAITSGAEYDAVDQEYEEIPKKIAIAEACIDQITVEIRNRDVAEQLKGKIRELDRLDTSPDLPVFFISNTQYQQHLKGYDLEKPPSLDLQGTGIPAVRNMLFEIPARGKSNTLQRICRSGLRVNLHAIEGILTKSPLARKEEVAKLIETVLGEHTALLDGLEADLRDLFDRHIAGIIASNESKWSDKASNLVKGWAKIKTQTFMAFCRKWGHWQVSKEDPRISWNYKIQTIFEDRLVTAFKTLDTELVKASTNTATNIRNLFAHLEKELEKCEDFQGNKDAKGFFKIIQITRDDLNMQLGKLFETLSEKLAVIRNDATAEEKDDKESTGLSYVYKAMEDTYDHCDVIEREERKNKRKPGASRKASKKSGVQPKCVDEIRQRLMGTGQEKSVFAAVSTMAKAAFEDNLATWKTLCEGILEKGCDDIRQDFDRRFVYEDVKVEEDEEAAEVLKEAVAKALGRADGELKQYVEEFEAYEKAGRLLK